MFGKALNFSDGDTCSRILATPDPKDQKHLGQRVKHYNEFKWSRVKSRVVVVGNWYKFREKGRLRDSLLETGERELCEASPVDRVWGIGFGAEDAEDNREDWGESRLGKAIMVVRGRLRGLLEVEEGGGKVEWEWDGADGNGDQTEETIEGGQENEV